MLGAHGAHTAPAAVPQGVNQMMEIFKMQYLMKFLDSSKGSGGSGGGSILTMAVLMGYDQIVKYIPQLIQLLLLFVQTYVYGKPLATSTNKAEPLMMTSPPPPATKSIRAYIQFERASEGKIADARIDAVIHHVCTLPDVRSLRYNGIEMIPNFKDSIMIESDIWFEIINPMNSSSVTLSGSSSGSGGHKQEPILYRLSTYDHDITWLHKFVEQSIENFEQEKRNKLGSESYYFDMASGGPGQFRNALPQGFCSFTKSKFTSNRSLKNVYLSQIDELQRRVDFFMKRRDWYDSKGIPHTLGIVMYGVPGCGKTSTIKAIANETKRHIFNVMLSEIRTKEALKDLFYNDTIHVMDDGKLGALNIPLKNRLYVIEDIDAMKSVVVKRSAEELKKEEEHTRRLEADVELLKQTQGENVARSMLKGKQDADTDKLDLATLLNVLDGVRETPGRIIILSTNYPERLDEALLRPGRFDMMLEFEKHTGAVLQQHIEKHYDITLTPKQIALIHTPSLSKKWSPAEVSQILFRRVADVDAAIQDLLKEDPKKLFKFSQMASVEEEEVKTEETNQGTSLESLMTIEDVVNQPSSDASEGNTLHRTEQTQQTQPTQPVNTVEDSEDDYMFFSGGISMSVDRPSHEQLAAENETRTILFKQDNSTNQTIQAIQEEIEDSKTRYRDENVAKGVVDGKYKFTKEQMEHINVLNQKIETHRLLGVMASPMFQTHDEDGICAADDCGLDEAICSDGVPGALNSFSANSGELTEEQKQEIFRNMIPVTSLGIAAANGGGYTSVDEFFPEPLVPFSF
jgi:SpoVK/Ycf46/Vps4 family AAA+-type ATPase